MKVISPVTKLLMVLLSRDKARGSAMERYAKSSPSPQNALDIFRGQWSSRLPGSFAALTAGEHILFEDERIAWFIREVGGLDGLTALELGPLEGGHAYMLQQAGAASVVSIEANTQFYLKCLVIKELLNLQRVSFLCGNFVEYLREQAARRFDVCVASGVLYHMENPVELLARLAHACTKHLFLWTHYYDAVEIAKRPVIAAKFSARHDAQYEGFRHTLYRKDYGLTLYWGGFCGGPATLCNWLTREDILGALRHFGFRDLRIGFERTDHPNGPSFAVIATK
jgi:hypothetical protein